MAPSSRLRRQSVKSRFVVVACLVAGHGSESRVRRLSVKSSFVDVSGLVASHAAFLEMCSTLGRFLELFDSNLVQKHGAEEASARKSVRGGGGSEGVGGGVCACVWGAPNLWKLHYFESGNTIFGNRKSNLVIGRSKF